MVARILAGRLVVLSLLQAMTMMLRLMNMVR